ncbi:1-phosphofructokinase family hexose kinase [Christiangramia fulva]|nr:PfkB family carbohydrate kinase [Christiangramia fulva]
MDTGTVNRISSLKAFPGGKGTHVACALNEMGIPVKLMGIWAGKSGEYIRQECHKRNIPTCGIEIDGENRRCYTFRSLNTAFNSTELLEPGPELLEQNWKEFLKDFRKQITEVQLIIISGSFPKNAPQDAYLQLIELCNRVGKKVIIDCSGIQLKNAMRSSFFGIHINEQEIRNLAAHNSITDTIKSLKEKTTWLALTLGKKGLRLIKGNEEVQANVVVNNVKSTVGSGDCLTAGIAAAIFKKLGMKEIARYGVAFGAANCLNENLGMLRKEDVNDLIRNVNIKISSYVS